LFAYTLSNLFLQSQSSSTCWFGWPDRESAEVNTAE